MSIRIDRRLRTAISDDPTGVRIEVRGTRDPEVTAEALEEAAAEIASLDGGWASAHGLRPGDTNGPTYVSAVTRMPSGAYLSVDGGSTPLELLATIPDIVARHLADAGVKTAVVSVPTSVAHPLYGEHGHGVPRAVVLHLFLRLSSPGPEPARPRTEVPFGWLEEAGEWVTLGRSPSDPVVAEIGSAIFPIATAAEVAPSLDRSRSSGSAVFASDGDGILRAAKANFMYQPWLALGYGGPAARDEQLVAAISQFAAIASQLDPPPAYAFASIEDNFLAMQREAQVWYPPGLSSSERVQKLVDDIVLDGFPFQLLGPRHVERLRQAGTLESPPVPCELRELTGGRAELWIGQLADWGLDQPTRLDLREAARTVLRPCLMSPEQSLQLLISQQDRA